MNKKKKIPFEVLLRRALKAHRKRMQEPPCLVEQYVRRRGMVSIRIIRQINSIGQMKSR